MRARNTLRELSLSNLVAGIYVVVVRVPQSIRRVDIETVFPLLRETSWVKALPLCAVMTFQQPPLGTSIDLSQFTDAAQAFKDDALQKFYAFVEKMRRSIGDVCRGPSTSATSSDQTGIITEPETHEGAEQQVVGQEILAWVNAGDPVSGWPMYGESGATTYDEVNGLEVLHGIDKVMIATPWGPCHMASHPVFGVNMYPATALFAVPEDILLKVCDLL